MIVLSSKKKHLEILLLTLLFVNCFGLIILESRILKYLFTLILFYQCLIYKGKVPYKKAILCYALFVFCSCVYSNRYNHQDIIRVIGNSYIYWGLLFVFIIMKYKPTASQLETVIKYLSITFCCCYLIQWLIYPLQIFKGSLDETNIRDTVFRMRMPGSICAYCLFFYGINKYIIYRKKKDLLYSFLGFLPIIIMGFRSLTAASAFFIVIMIPFTTRSFKKSFIWLAVASVFLIGVCQMDIVQTKIDEMLSRQESGQTFANKDYIRYLEYEYYNESIFTKSGEHFWGGGVPADVTSAYYKNIKDSTDRLSFYWVDLGLIGLSFIIGIPAVCILVYIVCGSIWKNNFIELQYIRFTLLTVLLGSIITSMELFRSGNILILSLYLCLVYIRSTEKSLTSKN